MDTRTLRLIRGAYTTMPKQVVRPAISRVITRYLTSVRHKASTIAANKEGLKLRFLKAVSGVRIGGKKVQERVLAQKDGKLVVRRFWRGDGTLDGVYYLVAGSWRAMRMQGRARMVKRSGRVKISGGTLRTTRTMPRGSFLITRRRDGKPFPFMREAGQKKIIYLPVSHALQQSFKVTINYYRRPTSMHDRLRHELEWRMRQHLIAKVDKMATPKMKIPKRRT